MTHTPFAALLALAMLAAPAMAQDAAHAPGHAMPAAEQPAHDMAETLEVSIGDLGISGGFARATLPNAPVGGGYLTIVNHGSADDRLIAATSPAAGDVQLHEMKMEGDVMKMTELADGIAIPSGQTVTLAPGGLHLMFMQLTGPLVEGAMVPVTLTFEQAGTVTVTLAVRDIASKAPASGAHDGTMAH